MDGSYLLLQLVLKRKRRNENETIREIARIASGEITEVAISHAKELRKKNVA